VYLQVADGGGLRPRDCNFKSNLFDLSGGDVDLAVDGDARYRHTAREVFIDGV